MPVNYTLDDPYSLLTLEIIGRGGPQNATSGLMGKLENNYGLSPENAGLLFNAIVTPGSPVHAALQLGDDNAIDVALQSYGIVGARYAEFKQDVGIIYGLCFTPSLVNRLVAVGSQHHQQFEDLAKWVDAQRTGQPVDPFSPPASAAAKAEVVGTVQLLARGILATSSRNLNRNLALQYQQQQQATPEAVNGYVAQFASSIETDLQHFLRKIESRLPAASGTGAALAQSEIEHMERRKLILEQIEGHDFSDRSKQPFRLIPSNRLLVSLDVAAIRDIQADINELGNYLRGDPMGAGKPVDVRPGNVLNANALPNGAPISEAQRQAARATAGNMLKGLSHQMSSFLSVKIDLAKEAAAKKAIDDKAAPEKYVTDNQSRIKSDINKFLDHIAEAVPGAPVSAVPGGPPAYQEPAERTKRLLMQKEIIRQLSEYELSSGRDFELNVGAPVFGDLTDTPPTNLKSTLKTEVNRRVDDLKTFMDGGVLAAANYPRGVNAHNPLNPAPAVPPAVAVSPESVEEARKWAKSQLKSIAQGKFSDLSVDLVKADQAAKDAKLAELEKDRDDLAGKLTKHAGSEAQFSSAQKDNETKAKKVHEGRKHKRHVGAAIGLVAGIGIASIVGIATGGIGFFPTLLLIGGCMAIGAGIKHFAAWRKERSLEKKAEKNKESAREKHDKVDHDITKMKKIDRDIVAHGGVKPDDTPEQIADRARGLGK